MGRTTITGTADSRTDRKNIRLEGPPPAEAIRTQSGYRVESLLRFAVIGGLRFDALLGGDDLGVVGSLLFGKPLLAAPPGFDERDWTAEEALDEHFDGKTPSEAMFLGLAGNRQVDGRTEPVKCPG